MGTLAAWAKGLARALLADALPRRWAHVQGVAARARTLAPAIGADADLLEAAAWLHDIGYLPDLADTGLHGLDGARYLRDVQHAEPMLCRLVAHHSCAVIEAEERGLADALARDFAPPPQPLADALTFCDMTTSPDGEHVPVHNRLAEIHDRYGSGHLVSRSISRATPLILEAVGQVSARAARALQGNGRCLLRAREFASPGRRDGGQHRNGSLPDEPLPADTDHMLELRPNCECCDRDLDPASPDVLICTYECTWCRDCAENILHGICPNCSGELVRRPIRPARLLTADPPSTKRVVRPGCAPASAR